MSCLTIVEATGDPYWGSGLNIQQTLDCLPDYWPGENKLGEILMDLRLELQDTTDPERKQKASSPLANDCSKLSKP